MGLKLVKSWLRGLGRGVQGVPDDMPIPMSIDSLQGFVDTMRALAGGFADPGEVRHYISWGQQLRDSMLRERFGLSKSMYDMRHLLHCMLVSGMLNKRDCLRSVVLNSLKVCVKEKEALKSGHNGGHEL
jgi:hypothetical protein